ncbi:hypothetical protein C7M34_03075 (plasmid) [Lactiplantibacillus plantarum]|nr:hypothetical protein C7M34_03075 [Lactiplantibacillus plantarum]QHM51145.1 hypothetical protein C7M40_03126 [Lactiplantibacillus plantarum]QLL40322.1 hypothetical protein FEM49_03296 [Lactiplantibacillus plantarum]
MKPLFYKKPSFYVFILFSLFLGISLVYRRDWWITIPLVLVVLIQGYRTIR